MSQESDSQETGTLFVVGTPIGNLEDITYRAVRTLAEATVIAAEDTRMTARLLSRYQIDTPCVSFREQNSAKAVPSLIGRLLNGDNVALVSDAGTPSVSDPGEQLVLAAAEQNIRVSPIPGPSALASAISVAALSGDGARFVGFLPRSGRGRSERLNGIAADPSCSVIYESPNRLGATLKDLLRVCENRRAVVMRELTKIHEEIARGTLEELALRFGEQVKGEITLVVEGNPTTAEVMDDDRLRNLVRKQIEAGRSARDIAATLAATLGVKKKKVYDMAVETLNSTRD